MINVLLCLIALQWQVASGHRFWGTKRGLCTEERGGKTCIIRERQNISNSVVLRYQGDVVFDKALWRCDATSNYNALTLEVYASGIIRLEPGSLLLCPTIILEANVVVIAEAAEVSANGTSHYAMGLVWPKGSKDAPQEGASHGGVGGTAGDCTTDDADKYTRGIGQVYGDPFAPWQFGKAGRGLGGGRVRILAKKALELNGTVSAAGAEPPADAGGGHESAGAGGSVWLTCTSLKQKEAQMVGGHGGVNASWTYNSLGNASDMFELPLQEDWPGVVTDTEELLESSSQSIADLHWEPGGRIIASGGCCEQCACGGGGRVLTEIVHLQKNHEPNYVTVAGGCWRQAPNAACQCGSAGTWVIRRLSSLSQSLWRLRRPTSTVKSNPLEKMSHRAQSKFSNDIMVYVDNSHAVSLAGTRIEQATPLAEFPVPVALRLQDAIVVPIDVQPKWILSGLALLSVQVGSRLRHTNAELFTLNFTGSNPDVELAFSSKLEVSELLICNAKKIILQQQSVIAANSATLVAALEIDTSKGELLGLEHGSGAFEVHAPLVVLGSSFLRSLWVAARQAILVASGSRLRSAFGHCDQQPTRSIDPCEGIAAAARQPTRHAKWLSKASILPEANHTIVPNVTLDVVLYAPTGHVTVEADAGVQAGAVLVCGQNTTISGLLGTRGMGCEPNRGPGPGQTPAAELVVSTRRIGGFGGRPTQVCGGGGGAHAGNGGDGVYNGTRNVCASSGGQKYDGWWGDYMDRPLMYPTWSASGGGGLTAGAGGGIVWLQATVVDLHTASASISASGEDATAWADGSQEGSGGGAGGSIIIVASSVVGLGTIEASGGRGGGCTGGGGGGGIIASSVAEADVAWENFTGELLAEPGLSDPSPACGHASTKGRPGTPGELLQMNYCRPGRAGIYCSQCVAGKYNPANLPENNTAKYRACQDCNNKPERADYIAEGWLNSSCPYACPPGFPPVEVNPSCEDPLSYWVFSMGGVKGLTVAVMVTVLAVAGAVNSGNVAKKKRLKELFALRRAGQAKQKGDEVLNLLESVRHLHPLADLNLQRGRISSPTLGRRTPALGTRRVTSRVRQMLRRRSGLANQAPDTATRKHEVHLLHAKDMPQHVARIYLLGSNSPHDPWYVNTQPIKALSDFIDPVRWELFAEEVNCECTDAMRWQKLAEGILAWLYLPFAEHLRWRLRRLRARKLATFIWNRSEDVRASNSFWRFIRDNSGRYVLKFGTDLTVTLGYIDVLDYGKEVQDWAVKPQLPAVLAAAGDGSYMAPFVLDYTDPFVQTVGAYFGSNSWQQVLLSFNILSRLLPPNPEEEDIQTLRDSVSKVWTHVLPKSDFEIAVVLFQAPLKKIPKKRKQLPKKMGSEESMQRQDSWESLTGTCPGPSVPAFSGTASPSGAVTPARQNTSSTTEAGSTAGSVMMGSDCRMCSRLALIVTKVHQLQSPLLQRQGGASSQVQGHADPLRDEHGNVVAKLDVASCGLSSPLGFDEQRAWDQQQSPEMQPEAIAMDLDLDKVELPDACTSPRWSFLRSRTSESTPQLGLGQRPTTTSLGLDWDAERARTPTNEEQPELPGRFWGSPTASRETPHFFNRSCVQRLCRFLRSTSVQALQEMRNIRDSSLQELENIQVWAATWHAWLRSAYRRKGGWHGGGVGRQPSLCLRHRKPRGRRWVATILLTVLLLFQAWTYITQGPVLFRIGFGHGVFFAALLLPPFADITALVLGLLFVYEVDCGPQACLFMVASMNNAAVAFLGRAISMETWMSIGVLFLCFEYLVVFWSRVASCRLINAILALTEAEPLAIYEQQLSSNPDYKWVRDYVIMPKDKALTLQGGPLMTSRSHSIDDMEDMRHEPSMPATGWMHGEGSFTTMTSPRSPGSSSAATTLPIAARRRASPAQPSQPTIFQDGPLRLLPADGPT